ncbi:hypothetical protein [Solobacterium moorei]|uniref:hypothetical protein n=1 Tax=Solobacterium moorei TaxID=102148 RepID=UPI0015F33E4D|nr:hypothetical protein [Solobacterium moorei]
MNDLTTALQCAFENLYEALTGDYGAKEKDEEIRIIKKGRRITAAYFIDGKCVRHANAKCSKEDKFNFEYGSKLAFKRMWGDPDA